MSRATQETKLNAEVQTIAQHHFPRSEPLTWGLHPLFQCSAAQVKNISLTRVQEALFPTQEMDH